VSDRAYYEAADLKQAVALLGEHPQAALVAGGTDLVVGHRSGKKALPADVIAIHRVTELGGIVAQNNGELRIGALVTHADLEGSAIIRERYTAMSDASALVGSPATRNAGTIGGNVCNASPAMEVGSPLLVFDAAVELTSARESRRVPLAQFLLGPAKTARRPDELLTAVMLQSAPAGRAGSAYLRLEYRQAMEIAIVGAAALVVVADHAQCLEARIALTAVAPTCVRASAAEAMLKGAVITKDRLEQAARRAAEGAKPIDDVRGPAEYRRAMVAVIVRRVLELAWRRATGQEPAK
jgi:CO/xanthine dehydrogenase FAD-binding subunit